MGNDHSREGTSAAVSVLQETAIPSSSSDVTEPPSCDSPRPSICSDADLPYISYTVNRPIGESPRVTSRGVNLLRKSQSTASRSKYIHKKIPQVVTVNEGISSPSLEQDPQLLHLQSIPSFLPIMRGALSSPSTRDPDILERLHGVALASLCKRYQQHLHGVAVNTANIQDKLCAQIKQTDIRVNALMVLLTERQRAFAKHAERLCQVSEVSHSVARCHANLNLALESMETLNAQLPIQQRLETFVWTTG